MQNPFDDRVLALSGPARDYLPVTPSDSEALPQVAVGLYVEVGGRVTFVSEAGFTRDVEAADNGWILCGMRQVMATGTTASGLHALIVV